MAKFIFELMREMFLVHEEDRGELVFVRHGESERQSSPERFHENFDTSLSDEGHRQARAVARRLANRSIDAIYSSPLQRAYETALAIGDHTDLPITVEKDLREVEIDHEQVLNLSQDEQFTSPWNELRKTHQNFRWDAYDFAESSESLRNRVTSTIDSIVRRHPEQTVIIVSHGGVINAYLTECIGLESDFLTLPAHSSLSTVRTRGNRRVVSTVNDFSHLN